MNDGTRSPRQPRFERVLSALKKGDARLLDGRDFDAAYWRSAKQALNTIRRELEVVKRERDALRAVVGGEE